MKSDTDLSHKLINIEILNVLLKRSLSSYKVNKELFFKPIFFKNLNEKAPNQDSLWDKGNNLCNSRLSCSSLGYDMTTE